jgi:predicted MFS family arabinose efflux permease
LTLGPMADRWSYPTMFMISSVTMVIGALAALLLGRDAPAPRRQEAERAEYSRVTLGPAFYLLFGSALLASIAFQFAGLGRSLAMDMRGFGAGAISSTAAISGVVSIPLPFFVGWWSDRAGRRGILVVLFLMVTAYLLILAWASVLWHFWVAVTLGSAFNSYLSVGAALVTDLVPKKSLPRAISWFNSTMWIGGIVGSAAGGIPVQYLGLTPALLIGAFLPLIAIAPLASIRRPAGQG